ncbi:MAG: thiamine phosphate synthase [Bacteroidales bacterium]|jgi:thiamine-phosphate pyrophosphorylase|nr:thiamine phosphate synthase [Bacteroidales bacterium]
MKKLLFISYQNEKYTHLQSIEVALEGGCKDVQLRVKMPVTEEQLFHLALESKRLCDMAGARLFIDDNVLLCKQIHAYGVHLGKNDMPPTQARVYLGQDFLIGGTANTFEDIQNLHAAGVDYIGAGPFRFTATKQNLSSLLGLEGYRKIVENCRARKIDINIYAIGGITVKDIPSLLQAGIYGIAMSSAILQAPHPVEYVKKVIKILQN